MLELNSACDRVVFRARLWIYDDFDFYRVRDGGEMVNRQTRRE